MTENQKNHIEAIAKIVCAEFSVDIEELQSKRRFNSTIVLPRQIVWALTKGEYGTRISFRELGEKFGGKDHATALHGCKVVANLYDTDASFRRRYHLLRQAARKSKPTDEKLQATKTIMEKLTDLLKFDSAVHMKIELRNLIAEVRPAYELNHKDQKIAC